MPVNRICPVCQSPFKARHFSTVLGKGYYCSHQCYWIALSKKIQINCCICGKPFLSKPSQAAARKTCSRACQYQFQRTKTGTRAANWHGGWDDYYGDNWVSQRTRARERDNFTCQSCGVCESDINKRLDVHHKKPFQFCANHIEANHLDNLITLCRSCHLKAEKTAHRNYKNTVTQKKLPF